MKRLIPILILATVLRFWHLTNYPAGFNADEAALGYNAYSLLLTGRDEHGHPLPVNLESFGDFKPALYSYLLVPLVGIGGLTEWIVRLPSALFGVLAVFIIYLLSNQIFIKSKLKIGHWTLDIGHCASFLLAVSPWHLHFSRGAWETNVATTFILLGVYFFVKWIKNSTLVTFAFCVLSFALSIYTYQSARIIAPVLFISLFIAHWRNFKNNLSQTVLAAVLGLILLIPFIWTTLTSDAASRFSGVGFLSDTGPLERVNELRGQHRIWNSLVPKLLHNRPVQYTIQFVKNYTDHWSGDFLFITGDSIQRNRVPETGQFYLFDIAFLIIGLIQLIKHPNPYSKVIWLWLIIAPLASALTFQTPHAIRSHTLVIPLTLIISLGVFEVLKYWKFIGICGLVIVYSWQASRYLHEYYVHYPQTYPAAWEYGFKELVSYVSANQNRYDKILITDKYDQPYILFLFYLKYPPLQFQNHHELTLRDKFNFSTVKDFDKYHFQNTSWDRVSDTHSSLIVAAPEDIPDIGVNIVKTINFPNHQPVFKIISN